MKKIVASLLLSALFVAGSGSAAVAADAKTITAKSTFSVNVGHWPYR
jgi:ABC-type nitrate/sulfonate/bicarbonate transport system substrate-binding protein